MKKKLMILHWLFLLIFSMSFIIKSNASEKVVITTFPQTARIYVNGVQMGTGKVEIKIAKNDCITVEVKQEGYIQESRTYCVKKGIAIL